MKPQAIEEESFKIIEKEAGSHHFSDKEWQVVRRMIHTTADFEYMETTRFHHLAIENGINAIRSGKTIVCDTNMARVGIREKAIIGFGGRIECYIDDPVVRDQAETHKTTRASAAVEVAADMINDGIYVIGNAPTALLRLIELTKKGMANPALIIGFPVGFVNAAESKAILLTQTLPYITNIGRKGGSNLAASVVNALIGLSHQV
jgi:precorrin-8X/cobalt-precorrin-8 methylmutase